MRNIGRPVCKERYEIRTIRVLTALAIKPQIILIIVCGIIMHKRAVASVWNGMMPDAFWNELFALPSVHDHGYYDVTITFPACSIGCCMPLSQIYPSTVGVLPAYLSGNQYEILGALFARTVRN
ncbi:hypothetical protein CEXT_563081 [Caerostris extrusa]|uniref:Uncharacterized protein n=1 Tax=Caerostris extrusa TaxID=172846 RepID=A0AAV4WP07_CAEEX|nr:hypothetical protein CEXT_563081 [Caerostris extrusa]